MDPSALLDALYDAANARLGHGLIGVFTKADFPYSSNDVQRRRISEF